MIDIGGWMLGLFGPYGGPGIIAVIFLVFYIDAIIFPTLPEVFFIVGYMYDPDPVWGIVLVSVAAVSEAAGMSTLYFVVEKMGVPERFKDMADRYANFLIVSDEKMILLNRIAPLIIFAGVFISLIRTWTLKRALFYSVIGCYLKYGAIVLFASFFYTYFGSNEAELYTITFVLVVLVLSIIASIYRKRKAGLDV